MLDSINGSAGYVFNGWSPQYIPYGSSGSKQFTSRWIQDSTEDIGLRICGIIDTSKSMDSGYDMRGALITFTAIGSEYHRNITRYRRTLIYDCWRGTSPDSTMNLFTDMKVNTTVDGFNEIEHICHPIYD